MNPPINTHQSSIAIKGKMLWPSPDIVTASPDVQEISVHFLFIVDPPSNYDAHLTYYVFAAYNSFDLVVLDFLKVRTQCRYLCTSVRT